MNVTPTGSPRPSHTARDYESIRADLRAFIAQTRPHLLPDFDNEQGLGPLLVDLCALVGDIGSYTVDAAARAVYLDTTQQYGAGLRFARSLGYVPRSATAATVDVTCVPLPAALTTSGGKITAGQSIPGPDGTSFYLAADATIAPGALAVTLTLIEGVPYAETFDTTNMPRLTVRSANAIVADDSWHVFVGDPNNPANEWVQVDNVALETGATNTYEVRFDGEGRVEIQFGDGTSGKIPDQTVTLRYRTTAGDRGNVPMLGLIGTMLATITGPGTQVTVPLTNSTASGTGGSARESLNEMRVNIPAYIRSSGKLTTIRDFDAAPLNVPGVAAAFADLAFTSYRGNVVNVNIWGESNITFVGEGFNPPNRSPVPYGRYAPALDTLGYAVRDYLIERTIVTVFPRVLRPAVAWADLYIRELTYDPRFNAAQVHAAVTRAVVGVFERGDGFSVRLSDLYDAVRGVTGVRYFTLDRLVFEYISKDRATGTVTFDGGAQPADGDTLTVRDGTTTVVFEFDGDADLNNGAAVGVPIGPSAQDTMSNLVATINARSLAISAEKTAAGVPTATLRQSRGGAAYNLSLAKTGAVLLTAGMTGGSDALGTVREDRRQAVAGGNDPWPPGPYVPGTPTTGDAPWQEGGVLPYRPMSDIVVPIDRYLTRYYDEAQAYNNELVFNASAQLSVVPQVVNLRRLVIDMRTA